MYVDTLCCPKCGHELYVTALYDPFEYRYECTKFRGEEKEPCSAATEDKAQA